MSSESKERHLEEKTLSGCWVCVRRKRKMEVRGESLIFIAELRQDFGPSHRGLRLHPMSYLLE